MIHLHFHVIGKVGVDVCDYCFFKHVLFCCYYKPPQNPPHNQYLIGCCRYFVSRCINCMCYFIFGSLEPLVFNHKVCYNTLDWWKYKYTLKCFKCKYLMYFSYVKWFALDEHYKKFYSVVLLFIPLVLPLFIHPLMYSLSVIFPYNQMF